MPITIKMPALSPTMEEGTLARWLVKVGDQVRAGDVMAEIETDKATMEFEAVDEGLIAEIAVPEGTEGVKVGTVIATLAGEGEDPGEGGAEQQPQTPADGAETEPKEQTPARPEPVEGPSSTAEAKSGASTSSARADTGTGNTASPPSQAGGEHAPPPPPAHAEPVEASSSPADGKQAGPSTSSGRANGGTRIIASPLAKRIAAEAGIDLATVTGSGPNGRIVKADVEAAGTEAPAQPSTGTATPAHAEPVAASAPKAQTSDLDAPYEAAKLNNVRKVIARRLTEAKQTIPHIYLNVDVRLDALLNLRGELNASLEPDGVKLSVNDLIIKALARALQRVPQCNVSFQGEELFHYSRQDISVAVAAPSGLITPIIRDAGRKGLAEISTEMKALAAKAKDGKLQPQEYQGGTASLSNLGMFGTKQFDAVINPPQGMILAVGAGEQRPWVIDGALGIATVMSVTGSFDHRAIDGVDGAQLMDAFRQLVENPMGLVV